MKKNLKLVLALVLAAMMIVGSISALAASGERTLDPSVTISGLQEGDTVTFYQILEWNNGWVSTSTAALTSDELTAITGGTINSTDAESLSQKFNGQTGHTETVASGADSVTWTGPAAGLYMAVITPAKSGYTYNPVFVAADYGTSDPETSSWLVTSEDSYSDGARAKMTVIDVDKTAEDAQTVDTNKSETVAVGDVVTFTVKTTIPGFGENYTDPVFKITDKMSSGLDFTEGSVNLVKPAGLTKDAEYTVTENSDGFELAFDGDYLKDVLTATEVELTYTATVTTDAVSSVNHENNTVTVNYSNNPEDTEGHGTLKDRTNHYTFDIDANLLGNSEYNATELVKVGVDKDGNEITESRQLDNGNWVGALEGAKFTLYTTETGDTVYTNKDKDGNVVTYQDIESDEDGRISLKGLDAGVYWLEETSAPAGYIKQAGRTKIEIKAVIEEKTVTEDGVTFKTNELVSYTIEIGGVETASYTITNSSDPTATTSTIGDSVVGTDDDSGKIKNTQGVELPSTGGIGTTIFYVGGSLMVLAAAILLITKRRMGIED